MTQIEHTAISYAVSVFGYEPKKTDRSYIPFQWMVEGYIAGAKFQKLESIEDAGNWVDAEREKFIDDVGIDWEKQKKSLIEYLAK